MIQALNQKILTTFSLNEDGYCYFTVEITLKKEKKKE